MKDKSFKLGFVPFGSSDPKSGMAGHITIPREGMVITMIKKRLGNKGFSLLELLVGITMLAIIVVPVLHAFLTSSTTSAKAKEVRNRTVAAQNVLETYEASDISTVIKDIKNHITPFGNIATSARVFANTTGNTYTEVTSGSTEAVDGPRYKVYLTNVTANDKTYDAVLDIDASKYNTLNSMGIVDYKPMDAVYIQPDAADSSDPDVIAARDFASQAQIDSGTEVQYTYFLDKMTRKVTVTIQKIGDQTGVISCTALFHYQTRFSYSLTDTSKTPAEVHDYVKDYTADISNDFYSGSYTAGQNGIYGLYFFFYPNVPSFRYYPNVPDDTLDIINSDNINMSIYLIRQTAVNGTYSPVINLKEKNDLSSVPPHAKMYYNKDQNQYSYKYYIGFSSNGGLNYFWYNTFAFDGNLIGTPAHNRLYGVKVDLYKAGSIQPDGTISGQSLATFDASSLE